MYRQSPKIIAQISNPTHNYLREHFVLPFRKWVYRYIRRVLLILIAALVANFVFSYFFYTPKMWRLRQSAQLSVADYELLQRRIALASEELNSLRARERGVYRAIFSQDTVAMPAPVPYLGGNDRFGRYNTLVDRTEQSLYDLRRQVYQLSISLDDIEFLASNKDAMAERVPAIWPLDRRVIRGHIGAFGMRVHPTLRSIRKHEGVDFSVPVGTPIVATGNGVVVVDNLRSGYGTQIVVDHGFGYKTRYAHLNKILVEVGQEVKRGQVIGQSGNTGQSSGPHLHYEVIHRGVAVNPISYFSRDMSSEEFQQVLAAARDITYEIED